MQICESKGKLVDFKSYSSCESVTSRRKKWIYVGEG